ncbi:phosphotransferase enzyme family protein [Paractinoplanes rishiriensis]|uniref:Aminoglycoside phosphotransferase n=1 Tax=Paractinoplanes rishiriensis TaxID=1050105 RepID=A0A919KA48_9ACTN|nr:phosphotransferase [Actinoplanes rishiriensis]GIE99446.1 aminoglycoside phosphotransferase [Actinoplanes rishiriensis]
MRVTHSLLHAEDLARRVEREYAVAAPVTVSLLNRGFNDTYLVVDAEGGRRVLRVYNREKYWIRSESDLRFELDLLEHLGAAGLGVIRPYQRTGGDRLGRLTAPEGERCFALFTHAPGSPLFEGTMAEGLWREFGSGIARMHREMDAFRTGHDRYHLDERILVERPLAGLARYAGSGRAAADLAELGKLGAWLTGELRRLRAVGGAYGIIHADLHRGNTHIDGDGRFVTFDFDHCGFGLRAYDLIALYRGPDSPAEEQERWAAVLAGYQQVRPLSRDEVAAFPVLAACRAMWDVGDWLGAADRTGDAWMTDAVIAKLLADVRKATAGQREPASDT